MADVFVVALFITYLVAIATQSAARSLAVGRRGLWRLPLASGQGSTGSPRIACSRSPRNNSRRGSRAG